MKPSNAYRRIFGWVSMSRRSFGLAFGHGDGLAGRQHTSVKTPESRKPGVSPEVSLRTGTKHPRDPA